MILFLYNTGARAQETADLRAQHLDLGEHPIVRLHGKGGKWRTCPLWQQTAQLLTSLPGPAGVPPAPGAPVFAAHGQPLTRYGIYKIIRRHAARFDDPRTGRQVGPHTLRHTALSVLPGRCELREFSDVTRPYLRNIRYFQARQLRLRRELIQCRAGGVASGWIRAVGRPGS